MVIVCIGDLPGITIRLVSYFKARMTSCCCCWFGHLSAMRSDGQMVRWCMGG